VPHLTGRTLAEVEIFDHRLTDPEPPSTVASRLSGARIHALGRRGKYLLIELEDGAALTVHLRMTGNLLWLPSPPEVAPPFLRARALLDDRSYLGYTDVRRFGTWRVAEDGAEALLAGKLGPEPLGDWTVAELVGALAGRKAPVKAALLDQRVVAGVGNIYADEALFAARVHPARCAPPCRRASTPRAPRSAISAPPTVATAPPRSVSPFTAEPASPASAAARRFGGPSSPSAGRSTARTASASSGPPRRRAVR